MGFSLSTEFSLSASYLDSIYCWWQALNFYLSKKIKIIFSYDKGYDANFFYCRQSCKHYPKLTYKVEDFEFEVITLYKDIQCENIDIIFFCTNAFLEEVSVT